MLPQHVFLLARGPTTPCLFGFYNEQRRIPLIFPILARKLVVRNDLFVASYYLGLHIKVDMLVFVFLRETREENQVKKGASLYFFVKAVTWPALNPDKVLDFI